MAFWSFIFYTEGIKLLKVFLSIFPSKDIAFFHSDDNYNIEFALMNMYVLRKCLKKQQQYFKATKLKITLSLICMFGRNNGSGYLSWRLCQSQISVWCSVLWSWHCRISATCSYSLSLNWALRLYQQLHWVI